MKVNFNSRAFSIENGVGTTPEIVEHTTSAATLLNELQRVKEDLKNKDNEIRQAYELRENTDREIEDLTSSLFEVRDRSAEKLRVRLGFLSCFSPHIQWSNKPNTLKPMPNKNSKLQIKQYIATLLFPNKPFCFFRSKL